jgi:hypothetical protein
MLGVMRVPRALSTVFCTVLSALLLGSAAFAACPTDADTLTVDGVGTVYASGGYDIGEGTSTFTEACLERGAWTIRFPVLRITGEGAAAQLSAEGATLETVGASGTLGTIRGTADDLRFNDARLNITDAYNLESLPRGTYRASATTGALAGQVLRLSTVRLERLGGAGVQERFDASALELRGSQGTVTGLQYGSANFSVGATTANLSTDGLTIGNLNGLVGRNASGSELTFTARGALRLPNGAFRLKGATLRVLGIGIGLGDVVYDPACPPEFPLAFNPGSGLTIGIDAARLTCDGSARFTLIGYDLFAATRGYSVFLAINQGAFSLFAGQRRTESGRLELANHPEVGVGSSLSIDSGTNLEGTLQGEQFIEGRTWLVTRVDAGPLVVRPRLELGTAGQTRSSLPDAFLPFARGRVDLSTGFGVGAFSANAAIGSRFTVYTDGRTAADLNASAGASVSLGAFSIASGVRYAQQLQDAPIARHNVTNLTRLDVNLRLSSSTPAPELGYSGLQLQNPLAALKLEYDLRAGAFVVQRVDFGLGIGIYNGAVLTDHFGVPFQTPVFAVRLSAWYDFVPQNGEVGALFSISGIALVYDLGVYLSLPTATPRFSIGFRLR